MDLKAKAVTAALQHDRDLYHNTGNAHHAWHALQAAARFHRLKNAQRPSKTAQDAFARFEKAAKAVSDGKAPATNAAQALVKAREKGVPFFGEPTKDWLSARDVLAKTSGLDDIFAEARMMRLFRARDEVGGTLAASWLATGGYAGAQRAVELALDRQVLMSADREPSGCMLMSIHKSKGKEFDGVILVEGAHASPFLDSREKPPHRPAGACSESEPRVPARWSGWCARITHHL